MSGRIQRILCVMGQSKFESLLSSNLQYVRAHTQKSLNGVSDQSRLHDDEKGEWGLLLLQAYLCSPFWRSLSSITGVRSSLQLRACQSGSNVRAIMSALARLTIM